MQWYMGQYGDSVYRPMSQGTLRNHQKYIDYWYQLQKMFKPNVCTYYGNTGCGVFKRGIQNWKDFCLQINPKEFLTLFDTSPLHQFSKFNNFLWVRWSLGKNLSNFVSPAWKLDNLYYHKLHMPTCLTFLSMIKLRQCMSRKTLFPEGTNFLTDKLQTFCARKH